MQPVPVTEETLFLAIESSCDDTGVAIFRGPVLLGQLTAAQLEHAEWGGVVPEVASRAHQRALLPLVEKILSQTGTNKEDLAAIAYTRGPGLLGALLVGQQFAKGLAMALGIPLVPVNHMQAHVLAHYIKEPNPPFPFLCLTVSGGHTQIVRVDSALQMEVIGQTLDDAAGEAFDKCAKMLGLPYPGGPLIDRHAASGNPNAVAFPVADVAGLDYSFSGLKTAVLYYLQGKDSLYKNDRLDDICASVQHTIIKTLLKKLELAATQTGIRHVALAGGVSANKGLRLALKELSIKKGWQTYIPDFEFCTDNAAMIGMAGWFLMQAGIYGELTDEPLVRG